VVSIACSVPKHYYNRKTGRKGLSYYERLPVLGGTNSNGNIILTSDSMEAVAGMSKKCPMLEGNDQITIYEAMAM
jgi:hypothetical protein